jgi:hypothetical protein
MQSHKIVLASTVIRNTTDKSLTGFLYKLNWDSKVIESQIPIPLHSSNPLWNERGGNRGGRGIFVKNGKIYMATATTILVLDSKLRIIDEIKQELFAGLHEIECEEDGILVTSTIHDLILKVDYQGNILFEWWGSESEIIQEKLQFESRNYHLGWDNMTEFVQNYDKYVAMERMHLNAVTRFKNQIYVLASRRNALLKIHPLPEKVVIHDKTLSAPHNILITTYGEILINDTRNQCIRIYDLNDGSLLKTIKTEMYTIPIKSDQFDSPGWQRGMSFADENKIIVGTSPATIFMVDLKTFQIEDSFVIDTDPRHCIHGLYFTHSSKLI